MKSRSTSGLVYSTEHGRMCPDCRQPIDACHCKTLETLPAGDGIARITREKAGRGGKEVTVIRGVPLNGSELAQLGKALKASCGCGGTVKDGVIELQGDRREKVVSELGKRGFTVKLAGG